MKIILAILLATVLLATPAIAGERIDLIAPDQAQSGTMTYEIARVVIDWENSRVVVVLRGANGVRKQVVYGDFETDPGVAPANGRGMLNEMSRSNHQIKSLQRKVLERLVADGYLLGIVSGTPDRR